MISPCKVRETELNHPMTIWPDGAIRSSLALVFPGGTIFLGPRPPPIVYSCVHLQWRCAERSMVLPGTIIQWTTKKAEESGSARVQWGSSWDCR